MEPKQYCKHRMARVWQRHKLWRCRSCGQEMDEKMMKARAEARARGFVGVQRTYKVDSECG